jgi:glycerophosphoryl diester phosphodiesterase
MIVMFGPYCRAVASSSRPRHPFFDFPTPLAFAHRGGAGDAPENTLPAFQNAVDLGYRYLETDVHVTADGVVVAFHDDDLSRTTGRPGLIHELPWSEVATARVDGTEPIPRLVDLLRAFPDRRVNIDCKTDAAVGPLGDVLEAEKVLDRVCVAGFSDRRLMKLRGRLGPDLCTSAGPIELGVLKLLQVAPPGVLAAQVPIDLKGFPVVTDGFVRACHRRGVEVHVWTIDEPAEMDRLLDLGVDGIMSDRPAVLKDVLVRRGQWNS